MEDVIAGLVSQFERGQMSRRGLIQALAVATTAAIEIPAAAADGSASPFKAVAVNHISLSCPDYRPARDFYANLFGMKIAGDDGTKSARLTFGETTLITRNVLPDSYRKPYWPQKGPFVDHLAYTIENWDTAKVKAELERRGLKPTPDGDKSFHVEDPNGFDVQLSAGKA